MMIEDRVWPSTTVRVEPGSSQPVLYPPTLPAAPRIHRRPSAGPCDFRRWAGLPAPFAYAAAISSLRASSLVYAAGAPDGRSMGVIVARSYIPCRSGWPSAVRGILYGLDGDGAV